MGSNVEHTVEVTEDDVVALYQQSLLRSPVLDDTYRKNWRTGIIAGLTVASTIAAVAYWTAADPSKGLTRAISWLVAYSAIWPIYAWRNLRRSVFDRKLLKHAKKLVKDRKVPVVLGPAIITLADDCITFTDSQTQVSKPWSTVASTFTDSHGAYVECADRGLLRIPSHSFPSQAAQKQFLDEVEQRRLHATPTI